MTQSEIHRLKQIETELAYLRKEIESFREDKRVEIHYHYTNDYNEMKKIIDYFKQELE